MLTYRTGAAGSQTAAKAMASHLLEQTISPRDQGLAQYYQRGMEGHGHDGTVPEPRRDMDPRVAVALGLDQNRPPSIDEITNLLQGRRGDGGDIELPANGRPRSVGFIDLCWSADKSVSLAWAFAPTEAERALIWSAHRDAVDSAMAYVETEIGRARKGDNNKGYRFELGHIGWVAFDHYASRPTVEVARVDSKGAGYTELVTLKTVGDPQLHTHVAVPNLVATESGRIGSLDLQRLQGRVHEFGAYYQAHLATNLRRHGVDVVLDQKTGAARIASIPDRVRDSFSKRTKDALETARTFAAREGVDWDALSAERKVGLIKDGAKQTRRSKTDDVSDWADWRRQAKELRWSHRSVLRPDAQRHALSREQRHDIAYRAGVPLFDDELQRRAVLTGADARVLACRGLIASGVEGPSDISAVTRQFRERGVTQDGNPTALIWAQEYGRNRGPDRTTITTALHESQENEVVALVRKANGDRGRALDKGKIDDAVARSPLDFTTTHGKRQREIMDRLGQGGRFELAIGVAGSGKSSLLAPLVDAWKTEGRTVHGVALAWRQTEDLADAGIESRAAMAKFLHPSFHEKQTLDRNTVVAIDEIGLVGTRQMLTLLRLQEKHGFSIVALGDNRQCQSIEAGPVITLMERALGKEHVPEILSTVRQRTQYERDTTLLFREGRAAEALALKRSDGTAQTVPGGYREAVEHVAALWKARMEANRDNPDFRLTVSTQTNAEARDIGAAIRGHRRAWGEVGKDRMVLKVEDQVGNRFDLPLAIGDRVRMFARATARFDDGKRGPMGANGRIVEVRDIVKGGLRLRDEQDREGWVAWDDLRRKGESGERVGLVRLTYGEALTINAAQGVSSDEHINAMPNGTRGINGFEAYAAGSRHRITTWLVASDGAERKEIYDRRPLGDVRPIKADDVWENMARNLSRQPEKGSALAFLDRAKAVKRSTAVRLQKGLQPGEARSALGKAWTTLPARLERHRTVRAAARVIRQVDSLRPVVAQTVRRVRESGQGWRMGR